MKIRHVVVLCLSLSAVPLFGATYLEPKEGQILFRTDQLPIDVDTMTWLSKQLTIVAAREGAVQPKQLRANAQLVAIARILDRENKQAHQLNNKLKDNLNFDRSPGQDVSKATARIWSIINFLSSESAGINANTLASYIKDPMHIVDPNHPSVKNYTENLDRWRDVVPELGKYEATLIVKNDRDIPPNRPQITDEPDLAKPDEQPERPRDESKKPLTWNQKSLAVSFFLEGYIMDNEKKRSFSGFSQMNIEILPSNHPGEELLKIDMKPSFEHDYQNKHLSNMTRQAITANWHKLPAANLKVTLERLGYIKSSSYMSAALATALNSSLADQKLKTGILVLSSIDESGKYTRSDDYWKVLAKITEESGMNVRILVPVPCEGDYKQLIALEKPEFFVRNEIISVKNLKDALSYTGIEDQDNILKATQAFKDFQKVAGSRSVGALVANKHVRAKLEEVVALMPNHVSAKMLLLQGSGSRPTKLESRYLAYELEDAVKNLKSIVSKDEVIYMNSQQLNDEATDLDERLDQLERYIDSSNNDVKDLSKKMVATLKMMSRALEKRESDYHEKLARKSFVELQQTYHLLDLKLAQMTDRKIKRDE